MQLIQRIILGELSPDQIDFDQLIQLAETTSVDTAEYHLLQQAIHIALKHSVSQANILLRQYLHESD